MNIGEISQKSNIHHWLSVKSIILDFDSASKHVVSKSTIASETNNGSIRVKLKYYNNNNIILMVIFKCYFSGEFIALS